MNYFRKLLLLLAITLLITRCSTQEQLVLPDLPTLATDISSIEVTRGAVATFEVTIAAPGIFRELGATVDKGTVSLSNIVGVGTQSATATVTYTGPPTTGSATIHLKATDKSSQDVGKDIAVTITQAAPIDIEGGDAEGVWGPYVTLNVKGNITIPAGKSLTIREGTTVIMNAGAGFTVEGNFYTMGNAAYPNSITVSNKPTKAEDVYTTSWSGVVGTATSAEMVALYTKFSFTSNPSLDFNNPAGKFIMQYDTVQYTNGTGVHINQGEFLVSNSKFIFNGDSGGDALFIENGAKGDVSYNAFIYSAVNGVRVSNATVVVYNNTLIYCGGSITVEKASAGLVYNNMVVDCGYGVLFPKDSDAPDLTKSKSGYTFYYGSTDDIVAGFYPENGSLTKGSATLHDVAGAKSANDPRFVKISGNSPLGLDYNLALAADSPAFGKGFTNFTKSFDRHTLSGVEYLVPTQSSTVGATTKVVVATP